MVDVMFWLVPRFPGQEASEEKLDLLVVNLDVHIIAGCPSDVMALSLHTTHLEEGTGYRIHCMWATLYRICFA